MSPSPKRTKANPVTVLVVGAVREEMYDNLNSYPFKIYASFCLTHPSLATVVAVCESNAKRQSNFALRHKIEPKNVLSDYKQITKGLAQCAVVSTLDQSHADIVVHLASLGYHILCEKPWPFMRQAVLKAGVLFACGHVLRYSPYTRALQSVLRSGEIGDIINVVHVEPVQFRMVPFCPSFVRGNWRNEAETSFSLMTKCAKRVSSFGSLTHFKKSQKPKEAGDAKNCLDCSISSSCPYSATSLYITQAHLVVSKLRDGQYGACVYEIPDNDVCDHQVTASLTMVAFTESVCQRATRIHGTKGEIIGDMSTFTVFDFGSKVKRTVDPAKTDVDGDGDSGLMHAFIRAVATGDQSLLGCDVNDVFESHRLVFAAEEARLKGTVVSL
ncbi:NAD(P)-binding protein [Rhizoclosmatium globosum]|uniref:NAD(P)-binding protein n=1 Tax=Rhizoclosmatium globosum TaxID=329046 RepID=A0A1Y2CWJ2_9FUNG|nr:NAD(P)-binding protein [Rhizoclosmatium globosum]|eukprot:ORY51246.1 NAD(P)-binding protein [Rhizoclosmatium globosum]